MGEIADMILDGVLDQYTGEYLGSGVGYPRSREQMISHKRTKESEKVKAIRKERKELAKKLESEATTLRQKHKASLTARQMINQKYGKNWRNLK